MKILNDIMSLLIYRCVRNNIVNSERSFYILTCSNTRTICINSSCCSNYCLNDKMKLSKFPIAFGVIGTSCATLSGCMMLLFNLKN